VECHLGYLDFVRGHGEALGDSLSEVFAGSDVELAFVCMGKSPLSTESVSTSQMWSFVLGNIVGIDEDVIQIYDDYDINHICENVIHKSLKSGGCLVSPSGITNHSKEP